MDEIGSEVLELLDCAREAGAEDRVHGWAVTWRALAHQREHRGPLSLLSNWARDPERREHVIGAIPRLLAHAAEKRGRYTPVFALRDWADFAAELSSPVSAPVRDYQVGRNDYDSSSEQLEAAPPFVERPVPRLDSSDPELVAIANSIREKMPAPTFDRWFAPLAAYRAPSGGILLEAEDEFDCMYFVKHFEQLYRLHAERAGAILLGITHPGAPAPQLEI